MALNQEPREGRVPAAPGPPQPMPSVSLTLPDPCNLTDLSVLSLPFQVSYLPRMCLPYPSLSPAQPSSDEEEGERQSPPLEVSDGEADGLEPGPGLLHGETGRVAQPSCPALTLAIHVPRAPQPGAQ